MIPDRPLPIDGSWSSPDAYVQSLLELVTTSTLLRNLCGGVHVLDFLTREPDLYAWVLPEEWRAWFEHVQIDDLLDLLLREPLDQFRDVITSDQLASRWRGVPTPPATLIAYIDTIRRHSLDRSFTPISKVRQRLPRRIEVGMKPKKVHEVANFAEYVNQLTSYVLDKNEVPTSVIDFGSGQNYLGRTLALPPYNRHVVAIERHHHNVEGARGMDVSVKLAKKEKIMRNKKLYNLQQKLAMLDESSIPASQLAALHNKLAELSTLAMSSDVMPDAEEQQEEEDGEGEGDHLSADEKRGSMTYIEHELIDGYLETVLHPPATNEADDPQDRISCENHSRFEAGPRSQSIAVSIHSCGNLTHHGLRSLILNPSISAVAMIGCCYNLLTERLGPATYKLPQLRSNHPRLEATSSTFDPHGFPMSKTLEDFEFDIVSSTTTTTTKQDLTDAHSAPSETQRGKGVRLNITARMMAVQAPLNWTPEESSSFFTRHFYRALLQRILLDRGVVKQAMSPDNIPIPGGSLTGKDQQGTPLIIGGLRKTAFVSFAAYVKAACEKLWSDPVDGPTIREMTRDLVDDETVARDYEDRFRHAKKHLSVIWSLMAFSAGVVESTIVVDRWLWLKEQAEVDEAWVQTAFSYELSPRNLVVVGIKKR